MSRLTCQIFFSHKLFVVINKVNNLISTQISMLSRTCRCEGALQLPFRKPFREKIFRLLLLFPLNSSDISPLQHSPTPDPYIDITRIRMRFQGHHCLYPGATFQGTQKTAQQLRCYGLHRGRLIRHIYYIVDATLLTRTSTSLPLSSVASSVFGDSPTTGRSSRL